MPSLISPEKEKSLQRLRLFFILWFAVSLIQGWFTGLNEDEAYYYMYAIDPDWGYFDHPPMVGVFINMGMALLGKFWGMRLMCAFSTTFFLMALWKMLPGQHKWRYVNVFIWMALGIPMLNVYGFVMVPDVPLLLFTSLFLLVYRSFLEKNTFGTAMLLGLCMAGMMYSKYHGVLVIALVFLSNLRLVANWKFWAACALAALLLVPHLWWQIANDLPSIRYHFFDRSASFYRLEYSLEYPLNQLLVFGPFNLVLFAAASWRSYKELDTFGRAMLFIFWGFLAFFFLMSFKGHVEPHWTVAAIIPGIYFSVGFMQSHPGWNRAFWIGNGATFILLCLIRILLVIPGLPSPYHHQKQWAQSIERVAGDNPVAFINSYQRASLYTYLTGKPAFSYNDVFYRRNQYDIWDYEGRMRGKKVLFLGWGEGALLQTPWEDYKSYWVEGYNPMKDLFVTAVGMPLSVQAGVCSWDVEMKNPYGELFNDAYAKAEVDFGVYVWDSRGDFAAVVPSTLSLDVKRDGRQIFDGIVTVDLTGFEKGEYTLLMCLTPKGLPAAFNSYRYVLKIE